MIIKTAMMYEPGKLVFVDVTENSKPEMVKVLCCTVCRSDVHVWLGNRYVQTPAVLGHEIVGEASDGRRISWTLKDGQNRKYGHGGNMPGGFSEYLAIQPGTEIYDVPENLTNEEAAPANCVVATAIAAWDAIDLQPHDRVLIIGGGALGIYAAALAHDRGCRKISILMRNRSLSIQEKRRKLLPDFGVTEEQMYSADVVMGAAGNPEDIHSGVGRLEYKGRYVEVGCVIPNTVGFDITSLVRKQLTIRGVHNYESHHLHQALAFLSHTKETYPFHKIVTHRFPLEGAVEALEMAASGEAIRVAVTP